MSRTLVIVTCDRDRWELELLCRSIHKYLEPSRIIIVCNEYNDTYDHWLPWFKKRCEPLLYKHKIRIMKKHDFWNSEHESHLHEQQLEGWVDQQVIKLSISKFINTPEYICLDSKNFFIRPCNTMTIKQQEPVDSSWMGEWRENWVKICCDEFGITYPGMTIKLTVNITPYIVGINQARSLVDYFGGMEKFFVWFSTICIPDKISPSEFFLYELWCIKNGVRPIKSSTYVRSNVLALWADIHHVKLNWKVKDYIKNIKSEIELNNIHLVGLHKTLRPYLNEDNIREIFKAIDCEDIIPLSPMPFNGSLLIRN